MIRVVYPSGSTARAINALEARYLLRAGLATIMGKGRHIRCIQLADGPAQPQAGTRYVHRAETRDNPRGVWAFRRLVDAHTAYPGTVRS